ncbi:Spy/CpxP family protein refolding chaperone [Rugamonas sp. CCM 8940]|uniref:Spy/CpxP family protein refolding chaperone n=1 Tax=Rugamonas sp. CCM 8940 TaxID=2765359 RepID=UPI0018F594D1|nr:Spy/CpxP family protein refolding chaperone [Rugamonas sp. CCM 8940]MBJ7310257.1 Spy/CpxP family protein refolding chaperone [Rugamonas sp. CCM 8940]
MNTIRKSILIGLTVLGLGTTSLAVHADDTTSATTGRHGHQANAEQMHAKMAQHFAARQAKLHDLLKLTAPQEAAWTTYQAAIKPSAPAARPDRAAFKALPAPERLAKMIELAKQHTATMESHLTALNAFYGTLTAEQKKVFDANAMGGEHGPHGMRHGMMQRG